MSQARARLAKENKSLVTRRLATDGNVVGGAEMLSTPPFSFAQASGA